MTQTYEQATERLGGMINDAHCDALAHPDPYGEDLLGLIHAIEKQASEEERSIQAYVQLAQESSDPNVTAVMRVLLEDERRHYREFLTIVDRLRDRLFWTPASVRPATGRDQEWAPRVRAFEAEERRRSEDLRDLARCTRRAGDVLGGVLLEAMAMDGDKHARLLAFVTERLVIGAKRSTHL